MAMLEEQRARDFVSVCGGDETSARECLHAVGWDLQQAIDSCLAEREREEEERAAMHADAVPRGALRRRRDGTVPPIPDSPMTGRTLRTSNFTEGPLDMGDILGELLRAYCRKQGVSWREEGQPFLRSLQKELMINMAELVDAVRTREALSTSTQNLDSQCRHRCSFRNEDDELADPMAGLTRAINRLCVSVPPPFPP
eukprot:COSAG04_NODE_1715_length_5819_cov_5.914336_4_plen_198_part_00